jgi:hypothetical protein
MADKLFANISLDTAENLLVKELRSSSTTADSSAGAFPELCYRMMAVGIALKHLTEKGGDGIACH